MHLLVNVELLYQDARCSDKDYIHFSSQGYRNDDQFSLQEFRNDDHFGSIRCRVDDHISSLRCCTYLSLMYPALTVRIFLNY